MEEDSESGHLSAKSEHGDNVESQEVVDKRKDELKQSGYGVNESGALCVSRLDEAVGLVDRKSKTTTPDESERGGVKKRNKKAQLEVSNGKVPTTSRVLRSRLAVRRYLEESDSEESEDNGVVGKKGSTTDGNRETVVHKKTKGMVQTSDGKTTASRVLRSGLAGRKGVEEIHEEINGDVDTRGKMEPGHSEGKMADVDVEDWLDNSHSCDLEIKRKPGRPSKVQGTCGSESMKKKLVGTKHAKGKRGRPPKLRGSHQCNDDADGGETNLKDKRRRPSKSQKTDGDNHVSGNRKRKPGRPPKAKTSDQSGDEHRKLKSRRVEDPKVQDSDESDYLKTDESNMNQVKPSKVQESGECCPQQSNAWVRDQSDDKGTKRVKGVKDKHVETEEHTRAQAKKLLRNRIVELLLAAGWRVEYRSRKGRDYQDAVYVNPAGKTHWSVTLAYKVYKEECEQDVNSKGSHNSFNHTLLPEEELSILKRETQKERKDKGKPRQKEKDGETGEEVRGVKRKKKQKLYREKLQKVKKQKQKLKRAASHGGNPGKEKPKGGNLSHKGKSLDCIRPQAQARRPCENDGYVLYDGKRTVLSWMIDLGTVPLNGKVRFMNCRKTQVLLEGRIAKDGIRCNCCCEVFTILDFEIHSGSRLNQPFQNLYLEDGNSLLQCLLDSWNAHDESKLRGFHLVDVSCGDPNDDTCGICGDGGDLICCDGCPSTFHQSCLDIEKFPAGDWFCVHCSCKFCGLVGEITGQRHDGDAAVSPLLTCCSCEEKYHQSCVQEKDETYADRSDLQFCGKNCQKLFERLQMLLGVKQNLEDGFSWTLLRRFDIGSDVSPSDISQKIECNCKLAVAFSVMDECFSPLVDHRSGENLLQNIVYNFGSNFNRLNYKGFLTAILERGDEVIGAASIRIHGNQLAEMPFIGTRYIYRRQGMCRRLMNGIESALCHLNVQKLVIPAVPELTETWTSIFGFKPLEASNKQKIRNLNMLVFPRVDMLQKLMLRNRSEEEHIMPSDGMNSTELEVSKTVVKEGKNPDGGSSVGLDLDVNFEVVEPVLCDKNDDTVDTEPHSQLLSGDATNTTKEDINVLESDNDINCPVESTAAGEMQEETNSNILNSQGPAFDACRQTNEIGPVASITNTKSLENFVSDSPFDRLSVTAT